jgi:hypothetical protein
MKTPNDLKKEEESASTEAYNNCMQFMTLLKRNLRKFLEECMSNAREKRVLTHIGGKVEVPLREMVHKEYSSSEYNMIVGEFEDFILEKIVIDLFAEAGWEAVYFLGESEPIYTSIGDERITFGLDIYTLRRPQKK